jgi:arginyl-tRNA synthetase
MGARIASMLRKNDEGMGNARAGKFDPGKLVGDPEWVLLKRVAAFQEAVRLAGQDYNPSVIVAYTYELAAEFSSFYRDNPVLNTPDPDVSRSRLWLCEMVGATLKAACELICIPFLEAM